MATTKLDISEMRADSCRAHFPNPCVGFCPEKGDRFSAAQLRVRRMVYPVSVVLDAPEIEALITYLYANAEKAPQDDLVKEAYRELLAVRGYARWIPGDPTGERGGA